eukprot:1161229-Pelagomonas_calceolata.AAC.15
MAHLDELQSGHGRLALHVATLRVEKTRAPCVLGTNDGKVWILNTARQLLRDVSKYFKGQLLPSTYGQKLACRARRLRRWNAGSGPGVSSTTELQTLQFRAERVSEDLEGCWKHPAIEPGCEKKVTRAKEKEVQLGLRLAQGCVSHAEPVARAIENKNAAHSQVLEPGA